MNNYQTHSMSVATVFGVAALLIGAPFVIFADSVSVTNTVTTSSNSGGNTAAPGQTIEGESTNSIFVHTEVNGEVVEHFEETSEEDISHTSTHASEDSRIETTVSASAASDSIRNEVETVLETTPAKSETQTEVDEQDTTVKEEMDTTHTATTTSTTTPAGGGEESATSSPALFGGVLEAIRLTISNIFAYAFSWI